MEIHSSVNRSKGSVLTNIIMILLINSLILAPVATKAPLGIKHLLSLSQFTIEGYSGKCHCSHHFVVQYVEGNCVTDYPDQTMSKSETGNS